ncbi:MAG: class I tRNA ligase family protein, partial [Verrucomicrobiota bacterium]
FLKENPGWIYPSFRTKEVLGKLDQPIPDMCISRPSSRLSWGIPLPFDKDQVTCVWFDALINYISVIGYEGGQVGNWWPAIHVIGKDIMAPAHAVYWPIMLKAIGVPMPQRLLVHGFWTMDQAKMSKSEGNVVDPLSLIEVYGRDAFRYYVLREMALGQDADFSLDQFHQRYQSELGNNLGNLLNRTVSMIGRYRDGAVPQQISDSELETSMKADVLASISKYRELMDQWQVHLALTELWKGITRTNQYIEEAAPWKLAKDEAEAERLDCVLNHMATALWILGSELQPILPDSVEKIFVQLQLDQALGHGAELIWPEWKSTASVGKPEPLYPRVEREES